MDHMSKLSGSLIVAVILLAGCKSGPTISPDATDRVNAILQEVSVAHAEEGAKRCLSTIAYQSVDIIDERRLIFRGVGDRAWLNELRSRCPGLRRGDTLAMELRGSNYACAHDTIAVVDAFSRARAGVTCALGDFKPIPPGHARLIQDLMHGK